MSSPAPAPAAPTARAPAPLAPLPVPLPASVPSAGLLPPSNPAAEPEPAALSPLARYRALLDALPPIPRATLADNAAFLSFTDGRISLAVRSVLGQTRVRDVLGDIELDRYFPGFRAVDVRVDGAGRTGHERRSAAEERRQADAVQAAQRSAVVQRLVTAFAGRIESIVPVGERLRDMNLPDTESDDE